MCGIVGIVGHSNVNQSIYDALTVLQHRGQDAAGIVTCDGDRLFLRKDNGMVRDVFRNRHMRRLVGNMGIGHVRYPTAGTSSSAEAQPFYVNSPYGITLAHNGNLTNSNALAEDIFRADLRHINTNSDSEVLLNVFAHELQALGKLVPGPEDVFAAVRRVHERVEGAYAVVAMITGYGILAFRDPYGVRPVCYGKRDTPQGPEYMVASESVALSALGFHLERDLAPGEAIYITDDGTLHTQQCADKTQLSPCIFEQVYLARPDSIIDDISVYKARLRMGEKLAEKIRREWPDHDIDVVIPIPDTSRTSALQLANTLDVKYREGFIKNRYIGRTFIMPVPLTSAVLHLERQHTAKPALLPGRQFMMRMRSEARVMNPRDARLLLQPFGQCQRVGRMRLHPQRQGFQATEEDPGVERAHAGAGAAKEAVHLTHTRCRADHRTAEAAPLTVEVLGRAMNNDVCTQFKRPLQRRGAEAVVHDQLGAVGVGQLGQGSNVPHFGERIGGCLQIQEPGFGPNGRTPGVQIRQVYQRGLNTKLAQVLVVHHMRGAEDPARTDDMIARRQQRHEGGRDRRHARRKSHALLAPFQCGEALFESAHRRIGETRVDVPRLFAREARGRLGR